MDKVFNCKKGYKLFEMNSNGVLHPLFIDKSKEIKMNEWVPADFKPTKGFSKRGGWHVSLNVPDAPWLRGYDGTELGPYKSRFSGGKRVWCEVFYNSNHNYSSEVSKMPKKCLENSVPYNGFYLFKETGRGIWVITSDIYINKILNDADIREILKANKYDPISEYAKYKNAFEKRYLSKRNAATKGDL